MDNQIIVMVMSFMLLCRVRGSIIHNSKEMIVLQVIILLVVIMGWKYTKVFFNNIGGVNVNLIKMSYSMVILMVLGRTGFSGVELIFILVIIRGLMSIVNSWSGYVVNK